MAAYLIFRGIPRLGRRTASLGMTDSRFQNSPSFAYLAESRGAATEISPGRQPRGLNT